MTRIISIGSEMFVTAFKIQGIDGFIAKGDDFNNILDLVLADNTISIVFLQDDLYFANQERMDKIKSSMSRPLFVEIPVEKKEHSVDIIAQLIKNNIGISLD